MLSKISAGLVVQRQSFIYFYDKHVIYDVSQPAGLEEKHGSSSHQANSRNLKGYGLESTGNSLDSVSEGRKYK